MLLPQLSLVVVLLAISNFNQLWYKISRLWYEINYTKMAKSNYYTHIMFRSTLDRNIYSFFYIVHRQNYAISKRNHRWIFKFHHTTAKNFHCLTTVKIETHKLLQFMRHQSTVKMLLDKIHIICTNWTHRKACRLIQTFASLSFSWSMSVTNHPRSIAVHLLTPMFVKCL